MATATGWESQQTPPLGVFWDIENCQVPSGKSALSVCDKIRNQPFCLGHSEKQFAVVCDATKESRLVLEELDKAQVDIFHVPANRKNAMDFKIKTLMRRFADTHRDGARIVLISGDSDFAGDIADFKRRMCLTVILLHTNQCSESLKLAATSVYNFQDLMSGIEIRQDLLRIQLQQPNDELEISNLPDTSNCTKEEIYKTLTDLSEPFGGYVKGITPSRGTALVKFSCPQAAHNFKRKNLSYEIRNRPIKIHFSNAVYRRNRSHSRGKSGWVRTRTKSDGAERQARHSSGDLATRRCSSQESLLSDVLVEDTRVVKSEPKILAVSKAVNSLSLSSRLRQLSGSSLGPSSGDEEVGDRSNRPRRMHAKMKSKLKLKNRKKSEATPGFRNKQEIVDGDEEDYETDDSDLLSQQIRSNITSLIDDQQNNFCPIELTEFEENFRQEFGQEAFFDLNLAGECPGIKFVRHQDMDFLDMTSHFKLGNEVVEVLKSRGGIISLDSLLGVYKSATGKIIDPTSYGYTSLEDLISSFDLLISLTGRKTIVLKSLENQMSSVRPDLVSQADGQRLLSLACNHGPPPGSSVVSPALRSVRQEGMFKSSRLRLTECLSQSGPGQTKDKEEEEEELVMLDTGGHIVTVETDTSDTESVLSRASGRGRKKSRMAASFAI